MEKYLREYNTQAEYDADEERKALQSSTISLIDKELKYDGINVEVKVPSLGDAVYHDGAKEIHYIKGDTVRKELLPADFVAVGVCGVRKGSEIYVLNSRTQSKRFAQFYRWKILGWQLDGSDHVCKVVLHKIDCADFTYNAMSLLECVDQLNAYLVANQPSSYKYIAYLEGADVILQLCNYNAYQDTTTFSTLTVDYYTAQEIPQVPYPYVLCGDSVLPVWNLNRAINYFEADNTNSAYNPTSVVTRNTSYPICLPAYLGTSVHREKDMCAYLRKRFGEGREGWLNFLKQRFMKIPYPKGMASERYGTGKENTYKLANKTVDNGEGVPTSLYPIADFVANIGFEGVKGIEKGDWFAPSAPEYMENMQHVEYGNGPTFGNSDPINDTLFKMGLPSLTCSANSWLMSRSYSYYSWIAYYAGSIDNSYFYGSGRVVPCALLPIVRKDNNI